MPYPRPDLGTPATADGPYFAAILHALHDLHDLLDARLPTVDGPRKIQEPAPGNPPPGAVPVTEPAPARVPGDDEDGGPVRVAEPAAPAPPRAGRGSSLAAWQAWADSCDVTYPADAGRDDIISACLRAGALS